MFHMYYICCFTLHIHFSHNGISSICTNKKESFRSDVGGIDWMGNVWVGNVLASDCPGGDGPGG